MERECDFGVANVAWQTESGLLCAYYKLNSTSGPVAGSSLTVQIVGVGGNLTASNFELLIPGGGEGIFTQGCTAQYGVAAPVVGLLFR